MLADIQTTRPKKEFRVNSILYRRFRAHKGRILRRLDRNSGKAHFHEGRGNIHYEVSSKVKATAHGGMGAIRMLVERIGLADEIDARLGLLKRHVPYRDSEHVLNFAYNALTDGTCLQDMELLRNDAVYLDSLGVERIPDPTTAGDFCRRFASEHISKLHDAFDAVRVRVWKRQPDAFFARATIEADGSQVPTTGECKAGMDIDYEGEWGYHPLLLSLAETSEVLGLVNRPGNRPSHEGAAVEFDRAMKVCLDAGFRQVWLRGDTDFSQAKFLDGWDDDPRVRFVFGYDAKENLVGIAERLPMTDWQLLMRPEAPAAQTEPRAKPENVKERIVEERGYRNLKLVKEEVAEFAYRPGACLQHYRMVAVKKTIEVTKNPSANPP